MFTTCNKNNKKLQKRNITAYFSVLKAKYNIRSKNKIILILKFKNIDQLMT